MRIKILLEAPGTLLCYRCYIQNFHKRNNSADITNYIGSNSKYHEYLIIAMIIEPNEIFNKNLRIWNKVFCVYVRKKWCYRCYILILTQQRAGDFLLILIFFVDFRASQIFFNKK